MSTEINYSFTNAIASLKQGATPLDETGLRNTRVFGKLMLKAGGKFDTVEGLQSFLCSESGNHLRAELFILGKNKQIVTDSRVFLNINVESIKIKKDSQNKMFFVELVHPSLDISNCEDVEF